MLGEENLKKDLSLQSRNLDCIDTNLWLGNWAAATDPQVLGGKKIKFILTINSFPLPRKIAELGYITRKFIKAFDTPRDDLLSHFEDTYKFIECAVKKGGLLVHCYLGVSRSATIVVSYLMKKRNLTLNAALNHVKSKRESAEPNPGFLEQLKLYETMQWTLDKNNVQYKMFKLYIAVDHVKKANAVPGCCVDVIKADPGKLNMNSVVYKCKKCRPQSGANIKNPLKHLCEKMPAFRRVLATRNNIIPHAPKEKYSWRDTRWSESFDKSEICQEMYFIEPLAWMENIGVSLEGKLLCPTASCKIKLGSFSWVAGCQCPCGTQVCPGFYLIPSKVDKQSVFKVVKETC